MAIEYQIIDAKPLGGKRLIKALLRDGNAFKQVQLSVPRNTQPTAEILQAAWDAGTTIPAGGLKLWNQLQLRDADENSRDVINAILDVVRANGTLAQMVTAGQGAIASDARQQAFYNRLVAALNGGTAAERWQFLALLATVSFSKIGQK